MKATLRKLSDNPSELRTNIIEGEFHVAPKFGKRFHFYADSTDPEMNYRVVSTSCVREIMEINSHITEFKTEYTHYRLVMNPIEVNSL
jgi:hypothetical protein